MDKIMQLQVVKKEEEINQIMKCNELSIQYGLTLTPQDVEGLLEMQHKVDVYKRQIYNWCQCRGN